MKNKFNYKIRKEFVNFLTYYITFKYEKKVFEIISVFEDTEYAGGEDIWIVTFTNEKNEKESVTIYPFNLPSNLGFPEEKIEEYISRRKKNE